MLLKMALNTITLTLLNVLCESYYMFVCIEAIITLNLDIDEKLLIWRYTALTHSLTHSLTHKTFQ